MQKELKSRLPIQALCSGATMSQATIHKAIELKRLIHFTYKGHTRIAEPHILGIHNGQLETLVFQTRGTSSTGELPNWRRLLVSSMHNIDVLDETFPGARDTPGPHTIWDQKLVVVQ